MNSIKYALIFAAGFGVGIAATYKTVKKYYEQIAQEEIDSVKERYGRGHIESEPVDEENTEETVNLYKKIIGEEDYKDYSEISRKPPEEKTQKEEVSEEVTSVRTEKYLIPETDFMNREDEGYDYATLHYYSKDGIVVDDNGEPVVDVEEKIGFSSLARFGEFESDAIYIRNEKYKCDYEVLLELGDFEETQFGPAYIGGE